MAIALHNAEDDDCELEFEPETAADAAPPALAMDRSMRTVDVDGHMRVENCNISKACVSPYLGGEVPDWQEMGLEATEVYMLYRDAAELEAAASTYEGKPLMMRHVAVSADAPMKMDIVGAVHNVRWKAPYLVADLSVWDQRAIDAIESGAQKELSCGYRYRAVMGKGMHDGTPYDGRMTAIVANHVALVETGRVGPDAYVADELPQGFDLMKKSELLAALKPFMATDADPVKVRAAFDAALAADKKAKDAGDPNDKEKGGDDPEDTDPKAKDGDMDDEEAMDAMDPDDMKDPKPVPRGDKKAKDGKKGMDEASVAAIVASALAGRDALHAARREVEPVLGVTTFDSAPDTYAAALKKLGIATDGVPAEGLGAIFRVARAATPAPIAADASPAKSLATAIPGYNRLK